MAIIACNEKLQKKKSYNNQSTASILLISSVGNPTAVRTITMVMRPAPGTAAAPMDAAVAVMLLHNNIKRGINQIAFAVFKIRVAKAVHELGW